MRGTLMETDIFPETHFLTIATGVARNHNMEIEIDVDTKMLNFIGGTDAEQRACAIEINEVLKRWAV